MLTFDLKKQAVDDARYLLNRGYSRKSAVRFVGDRFALGKPERLALYRCVHSEEESSRRSSKLVEPERIRGRALVVDGFNILWTVYWAIHGHPLFMCDDSFIRDITVARGRPSVEKAESVFNPLASALLGLCPSSVTIVYDGQISNSGVVSSYVDRHLKSTGVNSRSFTSRTADLEIIKTEGVVCSSDSVIIDKCREAFDLAGFVVVGILGVHPTKI